MAESKSQNQSFKQESILQNFHLQPGEDILHFSSVELFQVSSESPCKEDAVQKTKSPFRKLVCVTRNDAGEEQRVVLEQGKGATPSSDGSGDTPATGAASQGQAALFEQKTAASLAAAKARYSEVAGAGWVVVTGRGLYLLAPTQHPVELLLGCVMQGRARDADTLARCFGLDKAALTELAGDLRLQQGDVAAAVSLYRAAGTRHVKTALKLAASGHTAELLSFLQAVFSQNTESAASQAERAHLSNLSLLCQLQLLAAATQLARYMAEEKLLHFLRTNRWHDSGLAVRQLVELGAWKLLSSATQQLGLEAEVGAVLGLYRLDTHQPGQDMLGLLLAPHLLPSTLDCPAAGSSITAVLTQLLPRLSSCQLTTLLHNSCPARRDLQPLLVASCGGELGQLRRDVVTLFITGCLALVRRKVAAGGGSAWDRGLLRLGQLQLREEEEEGEVRSVQLAAGYNHSLYLCPSGELLSWGAAGEARLGHGAHSATPTAPPSLVAGFRSLGSSCAIAAVSCGKQHSVALTQAGVYTWGANTHGQLGQGLAPAQLSGTATPRLVPGLQQVHVSAVAAGQFHCAALDTRGRVYTWGWGVHGQLGHGGVEDVLEPRQVSRLAGRRVVAVVAGYAHTLALTSRGRLYSWGCGLFGQLGLGTTAKHCRPARVRLPGPGTPVSVTAGYFHNLAVLDTGAVLSWGANPQILRLEAQQRKKEKLLQKQLEEKRRHEQMEPEGAEAEQEAGMESLHPQDSSTLLGPAELHLRPQQVDLAGLAGERVVAAAAGSQHSALLTARGRLYTWGRNLEGQLGLGSRQSVKVPSLVTALEEDTVTRLAAGADFTVAVTEAGTVYAWGSNAAGQLGRAPVEAEQSEDTRSRVLVMKTTKRIIRLQHGLQNSCDVPRPVQGLTRTGIYPEAAGPGCRDLPARQFYSLHSWLPQLLPSMEPVVGRVQLQLWTHRTLELLHPHLDTEAVLRQCLLMDNPLAAAKLSLVTGKTLQAFDLAIQVKNVKIFFITRAKLLLIPTAEYN